MATTHTTIEWTDKTWNPATGCTKVSPGCRYCYAEAITKRFKNHFEHGFQFSLHPQRLLEPARWRNPSRVFVNSMSDLFHEQMPLDYLLKIFQVIAATPQHVYQVLTKRHERLGELAAQLPWPENLWMGVSVENQNYVHRLTYLRQIPARVRFLSCEPLLGPLQMDLTGIHWVIVGGESGPKHRPIDPQWVRDIRQQTHDAGAAFFFKQWGGHTAKAGGRMLDGHLWDEMPAAWEEHLAWLQNHRLHFKRSVPTTDRGNLR
ncbi:MAG: phage Gp37/Gp68 family protein [Aphanocapsa lilacina HA4352-LM1]|jgi:protein gp37|nr:phage Gp37/Gp68 family protein [Aphanocapsa lilacina HA4352-LM1]